MMDTPADHPAIVKPQQVLANNSLLLAPGNKVKPQVRAAAPATKKKLQPSQLSVNPKSKLSAKQLSIMLRTSNIPAILRAKIRSNSKTIELPNISTLSASKIKEWVSDFLAVDDDWEITTARLIIVIDNLAIRGQKLEPHIQSNEERGRIDKVGLMPIAADIHGIGSGILLGKTVPNERLSDHKNGTEIVSIKSKRGLVIIVTEIVIAKGNKRTVDPIKVSKSIIAKNLVHELAGCDRQSAPVTY